MSVRNIRRTLSLVMMLGLGTFCGVASAAEMYRTMAMSLTPIAFGREGIVRAEFNLAGRAGLALEGTGISEGEELSDEQIKESNGDSMMMRGGEVALYVSRYTNPMSMSGFYWAMGAGYRQMKVNWARTPSDAYNQAYTIVATDENGRVNSQLTASGVTGHFRGGYRYQGESVPLSIGAYLGLRHFESKFVDAKSEGDYVGSPATAKERDSLKQQYKTRLEPGIEIGFAF